MKTNTKSLYFLTFLVGMIFLNAGCQRQTPPPTEDVEIHVYDSAQVETILANAVKIEEVGKPVVSETESWMRTSQYYKVTVDLDNDNRLVNNPGGKENGTAARAAGRPGTVVVGITCGFSCKASAPPAPGGKICPDASGCVPNRGKCTPANCGSCTMTQACKSEKSGFGMGQLIIF